jgi:hypothetical protein
MEKATAKEFVVEQVGDVFRHEVKDIAPTSVRELKQALAACHWNHQGQMLEILEWVCPSERIFERARKRALDLINSQDRAMSGIVVKVLKENGNG